MGRGRSSAARKLRAVRRAPTMPEVAEMIVELETAAEDMLDEAAKHTVEADGEDAKKYLPTCMTLVRSGGREGRRLQLSALVMKERDRFCKSVAGRGCGASPPSAAYRALPRDECSRMPYLPLLL